MYLIESRDDIELLDGEELVARPEKITIVANEYNPLDWHGWLEISRFGNDVGGLSARLFDTVTVKFRRNGSHYSGVARISSDPVAIGEMLRLDIRGVDVLFIK